MTEKELQKQFDLLAQQERHNSPPTGHEKRFYKKLVRSQRKALWQTPFLRVAAIALLLIGLGSITWTLQRVPEHPENQSFQQAELYLTGMIRVQMKAIEEMESPEAKKAFSDSKVRLAEMQEDYEKLYADWKANPSQTLIINAMISNLQMQMNLLTELQQKINFIKTQNYDYETL